MDAVVSYKELLEELEKVKRERDAAVSDLSNFVSRIFHISIQRYNNPNIEEIRIAKSLARIIGDFCYWSTSNSYCFFEGGCFDCQNFTWRYDNITQDSGQHHRRNNHGR